jgi:hypothetical protein
MALPKLLAGMGIRLDKGRPPTAGLGKDDASRESNPDYQYRCRRRTARFQITIMRIRRRIQVFAGPSVTDLLAQTFPTVVARPLFPDQNIARG